MCGKFIRNKRKELGMTQAQLAEKLYITNKAVSKWETGESNPDSELLPKIAEVLGVSTDELLGLQPANGVTKADNALPEFSGWQMTKFILFIIFTCYFGGNGVLFLGCGILAFDTKETADILTTPEEQIFVIVFSFVLSAIFLLCMFLVGRKMLQYGRLYAQIRKERFRKYCINNGLRLFKDLTAEETKQFNRHFRKKSLPIMIILLILSIALFLVSLVLKSFFPDTSFIVSVFARIILIVIPIVISLQRRKLMSEYKYI